MDKPVIQLQNSLIRNLVFPVYGIDQAIFLAVLFVVLYLGLFQFNPGFALIGTVAGWGGMLGSSLISAPAVARITQEQHSEVVAGLKRRRFTHDLETDTWTPPLPRWLRWHHTRVSSEAVGSDLFDLKGPRVVLRNLLPLSDTRLIVTPWW
jgi:hypothetical protein